MPWVSRDSYSPGKRHYTEGVTRTLIGEPRTRHAGPDYLYQDFVDDAGLPLCKTYDRPWRETGYLCTRAGTGKLAHKFGGLSVKETVNLMQGNLCRYCVNKYVSDIRPDLKAAYLALRNGEVISG